MGFCTECGKKVSDDRPMCDECAPKDSERHSFDNSISKPDSGELAVAELSSSQEIGFQKYVYKTASLNYFIHVHAKNQSNKKLGALSSVFNAEGDTAPKIAAMIEYMLNYYAKGGWQFYRVEEFDPAVFMSIGGMVASGIFGGIASDQRSKTEKKIPVVIFRKPYDKNDASLPPTQQSGEHDSNNAEPNIGDGSRAIHDATCPDCSSPINHADPTCWKCKADFTNPSGWKPISNY